MGAYNGRMNTRGKTDLERLDAMTDEMIESMTIPRIASVKPFDGRVLLITFADDVQKRYDCEEIIRLDRFQLLRHEAFFNAVQVDAGGYGIFWNDEMDLSEYELWTQGVEVASDARWDELLSSEGGQLALNKLADEALAVIRASND
jgi:hypothetical protein